MRIYNIIGGLMILNLICKYFNLVHRSKQVCWHCQSEMIWGCDFSFEDYGMEGNGIVSTFSCSKCKVTSEIHYPIGD